METTNIEFVDQEYRGPLAEILAGKVFHLTTKAAYESICRDGFIFHNKDGKFPLNTASKFSFGRNRGFVCLFDFRKLEKDELEETAIKYNFFRPEWFVCTHATYNESNLAYLFINEKAHGAIVDEKQAQQAFNNREKFTHYIPHAECWYPGNLPTGFIDKALLVKIRKKAPTEDLFLYAHHLLKLHKQKGKKAQ